MAMLHPTPGRGLAQSLEALRTGNRGQYVQFKPYYQPIVRMDTLDIWGYEVLGRHCLDGGLAETLGPIFHALDTGSTVDLASLINLDYHLQESAVARLRESGKKTRLFINMMPRILSSVFTDIVVDPFKMHLINLVHKYDIEPNMIVVEITEDEFAGDIARLVAIVETFKKHGFQIAVDDVGSGMSDLSRIAYIMPDIIKVDLQLLQRSVTQVGFRQVLQAVSYLSHRIGASLLFEGIEQEEELTLALKMGARFLQGYLFSQATADFQDKTRFRKYLEGVLQENSIFRIADTMYGFQVRDDVVRSLKKIFAEIDPQSRGISVLLQNSLGRLPELTQRIALYDSKGNQVSAVFQREVRGGWTRDDSTISHNISWRPFFLQAIAQKEHSGQDWYVSEPYHDLRSAYPRVNLCLVVEKNYVIVIELEWRS